MDHCEHSKTGDPCCGHKPAVTTMNGCWYCHARTTGAGLCRNVPTNFAKIPAHHATSTPAPINEERLKAFKEFVLFDIS